MHDRSFPGFVTEIRNLLAACEFHEAEMPQIGPYVADLEAALEEAAAGKRRQATLENRRKQAAQEAREQTAECSELATRLKCLILAHFGPRDERLAAFGIKPARGRKPQAEAAGRKQNGSPGIH
jgi:hypothetical protein